ncbi:hypothetical protein BIW11_05733 [Tropilaelaps mercedesae]|uniref:Glutaredoxin-like protein n=1 Tax=Tropilaelaps mercedesae TaxID=418985 RepID=A0A1V9Y162_9ACAR|nr:hypothetical protein BIW11_05733 [Tropilaelaps mercedesae]
MLFPCHQALPFFDRGNIGDGINHNISKKPILTLFTKKICPLCEEAKLELKDLLPRVEFKTVDIEKDPQLYSKYKYDIPVFHLNGKLIFKHRANRKILEEELCKLASSTPPSSFK